MAATPDFTLPDRAKNFAARAHIQQTHGDRAFITHPALVAETLQRWRYGPEYVAAGWLHDVVEDTRFTVQDIEGLFGGRVALLVAHLTCVGPTHDDRVRDNYAKVNAYPRAAIVRLADRFANVSASIPGDRYHKRYRAEHDGFEAAVRGLVPAELWKDYALKLRALDAAVNAA